MRNISPYSDKQIIEAAKIMEHYLLMLSAVYRDSPIKDEYEATGKAIKAVREGIQSRP